MKKETHLLFPVGHFKPDGTYRKVLLLLKGEELARATAKVVRAARRGASPAGAILDPLGAYDLSDPWPEEIREAFGQAWGKGILAVGEDLAEQIQDTADEDDLELGITYAVLLQLKADRTPFVVAHVDPYGPMDGLAFPDRPPLKDLIAKLPGPTPVS